MTLPKGWAYTTLAECQGQTETVDPRSFQGEDFDLFSVPSYSNYKPEQASGSEIGSAKQAVREGDVLLCKIVPHIRRGWVVPAAENRRQIASGEWIVFRDHGLDPNYLRCFVLSDGFHDQFMQTVSGVGGSLMRARPAEAGKIEVPVPPLAEQRRIVAKLDALTARLTRARAELDRLELLAKRLRAEVLRASFPITCPSLLPIGEVVTEARYGTAKKCDYAGGAVPVLRIPNIQSGKINLSDLKLADFDAVEHRKLALRLGDVLVIRSNGSLDLVGRSAVVEEDAVGMLYAGYLIRLRPDMTKMRPNYLSHFLASPQVRERIESAARSTSGVNNVNAQQLQSLTIPTPSLVDQDSAVAKIDAAFARADRLEAEARKARALLDRLERAVLARAFRGELVPQDPNDEPASALLERIRAQRATAPKAKRGRKAKAV